MLEARSVTVLAVDPVLVAVPAACTSLGPLLGADGVVTVAVLLDAETLPAGSRATI